MAGYEGLNPRALYGPTIDMEAIGVPAKYVPQVSSFARSSIPLLLRGMAGGGLGALAALLSAGGSEAQGIREWREKQATKGNVPPGPELNMSAADTPTGGGITSESMIPPTPQKPTPPPTSQEDIPISLQYLRGVYGGTPFFSNNTSDYPDTPGGYVTSDTPGTSAAGPAWAMGNKTRQQVDADIAREVANQVGKQKEQQERERMYQNNESSLVNLIKAATNRVTEGGRTQDVEYGASMLKSLIPQWQAMYQAKPLPYKSTGSMTPTGQIIGQPSQETDPYLGAKGADSRRRMALERAGKELGLSGMELEDFITEETAKSKGDISAGQSSGNIRGQIAPVGGKQTSGIGTGGPNVQGMPGAAAVKMLNKFGQAEAEWHLPVKEKRGNWVNPQSGEFAKETDIPVDLVNRGFTFVDDKARTATAQARSALAQLDRYEQLVNSLLPEVGEGKGFLNWSKNLARVQGNRAKLYGRSVAGDADVKALEGMHGAIATIARSTGDTANIAVAEREMLKNSVPNTDDSRQSALTKIAQLRKILESVAKGWGTTVAGRNEMFGERIPGGASPQLSPQQQAVVDRSPDGSTFTLKGTTYTKRGRMLVRE